MWILVGIGAWLAAIVLILLFFKGATMKQWTRSRVHVAAGGSGRNG